MPLLLIPGKALADQEGVAEMRRSWHQKFSALGLARPDIVKNGRRYVICLDSIRVTRKTFTSRRIAKRYLMIALSRPFHLYREDE